MQLSHTDSTRGFNHLGKDILRLISHHFPQKFCQEAPLSETRLNPALPPTAGHADDCLAQATRAPTAYGFPLSMSRSSATSVTSPIAAAWLYQALAPKASRWVNPPDGHHSPVS